MYRQTSDTAAPCGSQPSDSNSSAHDQPAVPAWGRSANATVCFPGKNRSRKLSASPVVARQQHTDDVTTLVSQSGAIQVQRDVGIAIVVTGGDDLLFNLDEHWGQPQAPTLAECFFHDPMHM